VKWHSTHNKNLRNLSQIRRNESCRACDGVMSHLRLRCTYIWVMSHSATKPITDSEEWVMSWVWWRHVTLTIALHIHMSHVTHTHESRQHNYENYYGSGGMSHVVHVMKSRLTSQRGALDSNHNTDIWCSLYNIEWDQHQLYVQYRVGPYSCWIFYNSTPS